MTKIAIITGCLGGIGHALMVELASRNYHCCGIDLHGEEGIDITQSLKNHFLDYSAKGEIKLVVNCAGITIEDDIKNLDFKQARRIFEVNFFGLLNVCNQSLKYMKKGAIINVASKSASFALPKRLSYCASKGAVVAVSRQMAVDLAPDIRVNSISPGIIDTNMVNSRVKEMTLIPNLLKRKGDTFEVARFICDVAENEYITGQDFIIDGGYSAV